jgi:glutathione S-transferase
MHCVVPTLNVQVVLYESEVINEYLEESFPDPPMLPQQHLLRAKVSFILSFGVAASGISSLWSSGNFIHQVNLSRRRAEPPKATFVMSLPDAH